MKFDKKKLLSAVLALALVLSLYLVFGPPQADSDASTGPNLSSISTAPSTILSTSPTTTAPTQSTAPDTDVLDPDGVYDSKEDVALYIHLYGKLPKNFVTKQEAQDRFGSTGSAMRAGYCIGGDRFQNREGLLPKKSGRYYTECDIDTLGETQRGAQRIVFSNDGLVYYTSDHYRTFVLLYGEP